MCAILNLPGKGHPNNVYLIYDFTQVNDAIMIVLYANKSGSWEKIFINYENGFWNTDMLLNFTDKKTYTKICSNLELIIYKPTDKHITLYADKMMNEHAAILLDACS